MATFKINYVSEITETQEKTIVDITSPLFIIGNSSSDGVILYPQYDNTGNYVINSAQIKSSSSTFYK